MATHDDDIDAAFRDLVAGIDDLSADALPEDSLPDQTAAPSREAPASEAPADPAAQLQLNGGRLSVALVLAPIPFPEALHSLLGLSGVKEAVVRLKPWTAGACGGSPQR